MNRVKMAIVVVAGLLAGGSGVLFAGSNGCAVEEDTTCSNPGAACVHYRIVGQDTPGVCTTVANGCDCQ